MHWSDERARRENSTRDRAALGEPRDQLTNDVPQDDPGQNSFHSILFDEYAAQQLLVTDRDSNGQDEDDSLRPAITASSSSNQRDPEYP